MELPFISEFKNEPRVIWQIYLKDLFIIIGFLTFGFACKGSVNPKLANLFIAYNVLVGIIFCQKSSTNPKKRAYEALFILLNKDKKVYKPVTAPKKVLKMMKGEKADVR